MKNTSKDVHYLSVEERKEDWISKCKEKFGNTFDYSEVNYVKSTQKVRIFCKKCKIWFEQTPRGHLKSPYGCKSCLKREKNIGNSRFNTKQLINCIEAKYGKERYDFSKTVFKSFYSDIILIDNITKKEIKITPEELLREENLVPKSSGENILLIWLNKFKNENLLKFTITPEYCINNVIQGRHIKRVKIDFRVLIEDGREYWIEYNGGYHYKPVKSWKNWEEKFLCQLERDINVREYCKNSNGKIVLIELPHMYYNKISEIELVLKKILLYNVSPDKIIKQPIIKYVSIDLGDRTSIENINKLISIRNNEINENEWKDILETVHDNIGSTILYDNISIAKLLFKHFHVGDLLLHKNIREKLKELYDSINYSKTPKATNIKEFFEVKRNSLYLEDGSRPAAFRLISVKDKYKNLYNFINNIK